MIGGLASGVAKKRKAFFSFHYDDIMRVNIVRNAWKIIHPDSAFMRSFYDSSLWEARKLEGAESIKSLIRNGVNNTSAVCVLIGTDTWDRRWVRYEIARAIIDGRGLLGVHINSLVHHSRKRADPQGRSPLDCIALGKVQANPLTIPQYFIFELLNGEWHRYKDYTLPVKRPAWLPDCSPGYVTALSRGAKTYDYVAQQGHANIGSWIDAAAQAAGR
ncbi:MAG: TIR domain-containing protein [Sphingomonadaceae bacterium]|nr:TIR domain-containing protein [Sphingomonadaceae bacterium]